MARVQWNRGPWATQRTTPYQDVVSPNAGQSPYQALLGGTMTTEPGGGLGGRGITGTAQYGPMTGKELGSLWGGTLGNKAMGYGISSLIAGSPQVPSPMSFASLAPKAAISVASLLSSLFGGVRGYDREFGVPTDVDIQGIRDLQGAYAATEAEGQRGSMGQGVDMSENAETGSYAGMGMGGPGGYGEGDSSGGYGGDTGGFGGDSMGDSGGYGDAGGYAKGGVKTFRKPSRPLVGEAGEEKGIFVPERMKKKGIQGKERQVRRGLKSAYGSLTGGGRR